MEDCGEGVEEVFRERGYSEGDKDRRKKGKGLLRKLGEESGSTMTIGRLMFLRATKKTYKSSCHTFTENA